MEAGNGSSLSEGTAPAMMSGAVYTVEIIRGQTDHRSGTHRKLFGFAPQPCSPSARNPVRDAPECRSALSRNRVHFGPDSAVIPQRENTCLGSRCYLRVPC